jgi:hypothetical protein
LSGNLAAEWDIFRKSLIGAGVFIRDTPDQLLWKGGNSSGIYQLKMLIWLYIELLIFSLWIGGKKFGNGIFN